MDNLWSALGDNVAFWAFLIPAVVIGIPAATVALVRRVRPDSPIAARLFAMACIGFGAYLILMVAGGGTELDGITNIGGAVLPFGLIAIGIGATILYMTRSSGR